MRVLVLPYLYFKDFKQSSGVIHQIELIRSLSEALLLGGITVAMPRRDEGWDWSDDLFKDMWNVAPVEVSYLKDQDMVAGGMTPDLMRLLSPEKSPEPYGLVFNGIPGMAIGLRRFLSRTGFGRMSIPIVNYYDIVTVPEEAKDRGGVSADFIKEMQWLEVVGATQSHSILHTENELWSLYKGMKKLLAPSIVQDAYKRLYPVPRPYRPPQGTIQRVRNGEEFRIFSARSFGPGSEEAGYMTKPLIEAVGYLRAKGCPVRLLLATQSPLDDEWSKSWINRDGVDVMHKQPRADVMDALYFCEMSAYLCDYNGLYMSSLEAVTSGSPHIAKKSRWSKGEVETPWMVAEDTCSFAGPVNGAPLHKLITELMALIEDMIADYDQTAKVAYMVGKEKAERHDPEEVGKQLRELFYEIWHKENTKPIGSKSLQPLFDAAAAAGEFDKTTLPEAIRAIEKRMDSGKLGRYSQEWFCQVIGKMGYDTSRAGKTWQVNIVG